MDENKAATQGKYGGKMLTLKEAAEYLRMGKSTLYECTKKTTIRYFKPPRGQILFNINDLDAWLDTSEIPSGTVESISK